ncbi:MAG: nitrogen regulation protein NR(II) [Candidatus Scalinduaceae bacterium]
MESKSKEIFKAEDLEKQSHMNEYLCHLVENAGDGIVSVSKDGTITSWNQSAEEIFGYNRLEVIGQNINIIVAEDMKEENKLLLDKVIMNGEVIKGFETERIRKDGEKVAVSITISPIKVEYDGVIGVSKIYRTMTEEELMRKRITHFEKLISLGKLAAEIAHQVNSPLGAVLGRIQLILKNLDKFDRKMLVANLKQMSDSCDQIRTTIGSLLNYTRRLVIKKPVDIHSVIDDALKMMSHRIMLKGISVHKSYTENIPNIQGIRGELIHVFVNVISNAVDVMDKGGRLEIVTDVDSQVTELNEKRIRVTITDTGCGISEQNIEKIFNPFFTTKEEGKGTGLGLSIVKRIVKMHKGEIDVVSKLNQGTSFILLFPSFNENE